MTPCRAPCDSGGGQDRRRRPDELLVSHAGPRVFDIDGHGPYSLARVWAGGAEVAVRALAPARRVPATTMATGRLPWSASPAVAATLVPREALANRWWRESRAPRHEERALFAVKLALPGGSPVTSSAGRGSSACGS